MSDSGEVVRFSVRIGDCEVRTRSQVGVTTAFQDTAEIIKWNGGDDSCYTVAIWRRSKNGYDLSFIGSRPFDMCYETFFRLAKFGQNHLDEYFSELNE